MDDKEWKVFKKDGLDPKRRKSFHVAREFDRKHPMSFDQCVEFLDAMQSVFGEFPVSEKITITDRNIL